jgi:YebC/PmpR family DNA-binding regulatory protein
MSGHSHWAKIKRYKGANDAKRGRVWSKLARRIIVAARSGGGNPDENLTLRYAIDEAREENMPNDTIAKAIKKGTGELGAVNYEAAVYEGYGPGGVAFMVECLTDNRSRTAPEIRKIFERGGGQLGATNCVAWMFEQKGNFVVAADKIDEDSLMELALDAGADDVVRDGDFFQVTCHPSKYIGLKKVLEAKKLETISAEIAMIPKTTVPLEAEKARKAINLSEAFEENDDVQKVYANFELPEELLNEMEKKA